MVEWLSISCNSYILVVLFIKKLEKTFHARIPNESRVFRPKRPWRPEQLCSTKTLYFAPILGMWSDHDMIQPHAKYRRRERARSRSEKKKTAFDHLGRSQAPPSAPNGQNVGIQPFVSDDTFHVVGSSHDPTICKVKPFGKKMFDHFVRSQAAGGKTSPET
jgi:hypothetical protein